MDESKMKAEPANQITVVIPVRNGEMTIVRQLDALASQQGVNSGWEIIVADNGSTDRTRDIVEEWVAMNHVPLRFADASRKIGVAHARNSGISEAATDWVAVCDADDAVHAGWLAAFLKMTERGGVDLIGGQTLASKVSLDGKSLEPKQNGSSGLREALGFLKFPVGCNFCVRKDVWEAVGGFDEDWPGPGGDDTQFGWDVQLAGYDLAYAEDALVYYVDRPTLWLKVKQRHAWDMAVPFLYKRYKAQGLRRRSIPGAARMWCWIIMGAWRLVLPVEQRERYLMVVARNTGYLRGSFRHRVFYP